MASTLHSHLTAMAVTTSPPALETPPLLARYREIRATTEALCRPLQTEDYVIQAMPDASPVRWHLAHVSWFFETFLLEPHLGGYRPFDANYRTLFNSYYNAVGPQFSRPDRGHLSRPTVAEVYAYRAHVDRAMSSLLRNGQASAVAPLVELGLHHEQQHQELILTDIKFNLSVNPLQPSCYPVTIPSGGAAPAMEWVDVPGGVVWLGHDGTSFAFDNEGPRHRILLVPYRLATRPVTNAEYQAFIDAGGYRDWRWWTSEGWRIAQERAWSAPLYWTRDADEWQVFTLAGPIPLDPSSPVTHVSWFEADAFARWRECRLPTEAEWEHAAVDVPVAGNFQESALYHPLPAPAAAGDLHQMFGDVWEWTQSAYAPYPGYRPAPGDAGEYNGKFMVNQMVLRGGSCATPRSHIRASYRNFFPPDARWQFSGIRLAADF
jgi:ergothioneine biosynthesis protein EgtB